MATARQRACHVDDASSIPPRVQRAVESPASARRCGPTGACPSGRPGGEAGACATRTLRGALLVSRCYSRPGAVRQGSRVSRQRPAAAGKGRPNGSVVFAAPGREPGAPGRVARRVVRSVNRWERGAVQPSRRSWPDRRPRSRLAAAGAAVEPDRRRRPARARPRPRSERHPAARGTALPRPPTSLIGTQPRGRRPPRARRAEHRLVTLLGTGGSRQDAPGHRGGRHRDGPASATGAGGSSLGPLTDPAGSRRRSRPTLDVRERAGEGVDRDGRAVLRYGAGPAGAGQRRARGGARGDRSWPLCAMLPRACTSLVTSQVPLGLAGERRVPLPPLAAERSTCSSSARVANDPGSTRPPATARRSPSSASASTACRWRSSSRPRGSPR